jgi:hypothetical protein
LLSGAFDMGIFDRFKSKHKAPEPLSHIQFEFTPEESEAIDVTLKRFGAIGNAQAPEGMELFVPQKVKDAITAQGLIEYVEDLMHKLRDSSSNEEVALLLDKAIKAQMKAYAIHNLPVYLFHLAAMFEVAGDTNQAKDFFGRFLQAQSEFKPRV